jgi:hypothetical protein
MASLSVLWQAASTVLMKALHTNSRCSCEVEGALIGLSAWVAARLGNLMVSSSVSSMSWSSGRSQ